MSVEDNKAIARRWLNEVWGKGDMAVADDLYAADVIDHNPNPGQADGIEGQKAAVLDVRAAFPDMSFNIDVLVGEGDKVVDRWTMTGTHTGEMMGSPATGNKVVMTGQDILRIENGKIAEIWHQEDIMGMLIQVGMLGGPPQA